MKETLIVTVVLFVYFIISYLVYLSLIRIRWLGFTLLSACYLLVTYFLFLLVFGMVNENFSPSFYNNSIHVSNIILIAFFICALTSLINIVAAMARKESGKQASAKNEMKMITPTKRGKRNNQITANAIH